MVIDIKQAPPSKEAIEECRHQLHHQRKRTLRLTVLGILVAAVVLGLVLYSLNDQRLSAYTGILIVAALTSALIGTLAASSRALTFALVGIFTVSCVAAGIGMSANGAGASAASIVYAVGISILVFLLAAYWAVVVQKKLMSIQIQLKELQPLDQEAAIMADIVSACRLNKECSQYKKSVARQFRPLIAAEADALRACAAVADMNE